MSDLLKDLGERGKALGAAWTGYSVAGSFLLYLTGYLALRFHLTVLGIGTDLTVLDERYLFTGARFVVYAGACVPNIILVALPFWLLGLGLRRLLPSAFARRARSWLTQPRLLVTVGLLFAVFALQFVMRQCFFLGDLLLRRSLPEQPAWLVYLLRNDRFMPLYFSALVAACAVPLVILFCAPPATSRVTGLPPRSDWPWVRKLLAFVAAVQILMLPVNYGMLIVDKTLPRLKSLGDEPLAAGEEIWLVWEGQDGMTFLVRRQPGDSRTLLTLPRAAVKRTEIVGFDPIIPTLFGTI